MNKSKIIYNPQLSVTDNAINNKVSESAIRRYIRVNGIDRKRDNAIIIQRTIKNLKKKIPDISIAEICRQLNISKNTAKKYLNEDLTVSNNDTSKLSTFDLSKRKFIISSVSENQDLILSNILRLYIPSGRFDCDLTYSVGNFYKIIPQPLLKYDKYPKTDEITPLEEAYLIPDNSLSSVILDLPFVVKGEETIYKSMMADRFNCFNSMKELYQVNKDILQLAYSKLSNHGILVVKTMDLNYGGVQHWIGNYIQNNAIEIGFKLLDIFILVAKNKVLTNVNQVQKTARKCHSYIFVLQKKERHIHQSDKTIYFLDFDGTIAKTDILKQGKDWRDSQKYIPQIEIYPRAIQFIEEKQRKGNEIYIVSGNVRSTIIKTLEYFKIPIPKDRVFGFKQGYPLDNLRRKIRVIQEALKTVEDKKKVVYIGDEIDDFKACRELGIKFESEMFSVE